MTCVKASTHSLIEVLIGMLWLAATKVGGQHASGYSRRIHSVRENDINVGQIKPLKRALQSFYDVLL